MKLGERIAREMIQAKHEEDITYQELSEKMGAKTKQHSREQMERYSGNQGSIRNIVKMANALNRKIVFRLIKENSSEVVEKEEYFIDRTLQKYGGKTVIMFKNDGYQVDIDAMNLTDDEYIDRAKKIRKLSECED